MKTTGILSLLPWVAATAHAFVFPPVPEDKTTPVQQRLAFLSSTSIGVAWNTFQKIPQPCVSYGTAADKLDGRACSSQSVTYPTSRNYFNTVQLTGLAPGTQYYYRIESSNSSTPIAFFRTAREAGDTTPFTLANVADLGIYGPDGYTITSPNQRRDIPSVDPSLSHTTIDRLVKTADEYEFVIHPGDFAYADDWYLKPQNLFNGKDAYQAILENFYDQLSYVSAYKPYMAGPGNHEAACTELLYHQGSCPDGQYNFTDYQVRFAPNSPRAFDSASTNAGAAANATEAKKLANPPFWYSFEYGMAHVVMFNTETDFTKAPDESTLDAGPFGSPGQQLEFLRADLASVDRNLTPWIVLAGHRPWYSTGGSSDICKPCQDAFEDILYEYGVDVAVFGHVHNLQRHSPTYRNTIDPAGLNNPKAPLYSKSTC